MDSRTRVRHAIERKPLDRVPRCDSFWEDTLAAWREQGMPDASPDDYFDWDMRMMYIDASMRAEQKIIEANDAFITFQDRAGYTARKFRGKSRALEWIDHATKDRVTWDELKDRFRFDPSDSARIDTASYFNHMDAYPTWPEAKSLFDELRRTDKYIVFVVYGPWEGTWRHRGYTELLMDMAIDPEWVHEMAEAQTDLVLATLEHGIDLGIAPDAVWLTDDLACTRGMLFSPDMWRDVFKPLYRRLGDVLSARDISFWLHCCGNCEPVIGDLIETGLEVLQPLQARAGLDIRTLKDKYGKDLTLWGNIDVTKLSGPAEACEAEVRDKLETGKRGGGYMYHSDHSIPPEVTFDRYRWIMELVDRYGQY